MTFDARPCFVSALLATLLVLTTIPNSASAADVGFLITDAQIAGLSMAVILIAPVAFTNSFNGMSIMPELVDGTLPGAHPALQ
jgi:hypothetical protein